MKVFAFLFVSLFLASASFAQITTTITSHRSGISLRGTGVAPAAKQVTPLSASRSFTIKLDENPIEVSPDYQIDHTITGTITNLTDSTIFLNFHRYERLAFGYQTSVCFGALCLNPSSDSGRKPFTFAPNESQAFILHVVDTLSPDSNGMIRLSDKDSTIVNLLVDRVGGSSTDTVHLDLKVIVEANLAVATESAVQASARILALYPNPVSGATAQMTAQIYLATRSKVSISVYDLLGKEVRSALQMELQPGVNVVRINPTGLASGTYQLVCKTALGVRFVKFFELAR